MTKADIVDEVASATGLTKVETAAVLEGMMASVTSALKRNERVELRGFGTFGVKKRGPRKARNPGTGEIIFLPKRIVPTFKPSRLLRQAVNETFDA